MSNIYRCLFCHRKNQSLGMVRDRPFLERVSHFLHKAISRDMTIQFAISQEQEAFYVCEHCYDTGSKLTSIKRPPGAVLETHERKLEWNLYILSSRRHNNSPMVPLDLTKNQQTAVVNNGSVGTSGVFVPCQPNDGSQERATTSGRVPVGSDVGKKDNKHGRKSDKYECNKCPAKFPTKTLLAVHVLTNKGKTVYPCGICSQVFPYLHNHKRHLKSHFEEKLFQCPSTNCPKKYKHELSLKAHSKTHTGYKYDCVYCNKSFASQELLNEHKTIHIGELFHCSVCDKSFATRQSLSMHAGKHRNIRLKCAFCPILFAQKSELLRHQNSHFSH